MSTTLLARIEKLLVIHILDVLADPDGPNETWLASTLGNRVYTDTPNTPTEPYVRINRVGSNVLRGPYRVETSVVQVDTFGGPRVTNWRIAETVRGVIAAMEGVYTDDLADHAVHPPTLGGMTETATDEGVNWARFDLTVTTHPASATS